MRKALPAVAAAAIAALVLVGIVVAARTGSPAGAGTGLEVVAAESVWGSIATQLGGSRAHVTSVISSPATDPHDYEPTAADARRLARARLVIVNGVGYDSWAGKLLAANPVRGRVVLDVGRLVGVAAGGNPHRWYSPADVRRVVRAIVHDYAKLDPAHARYFQRQQARYETRGLAQYKALLARIRGAYHGVPVGASESILAPLAQALGLKLLTPASFLKAVSEGTEPTANDKTTIDRQTAHREIKVWIYNRQNSTPDVARITDAARKQGIPVTSVTETMTPASATFQAWQVRQLRSLAAALAKATGR